MPTVTITSSQAFNGPLGIAFDADANLWVANKCGTSIFGFKFANLRRQPGAATPTPDVILNEDGAGSIRAPWALVFDATGILWSSKANAPPTIVEFSPMRLVSSGAPVAIVAVSPTTLNGLPKSASPNGFAFDNLRGLAVISSATPFGASFLTKAQLGASGAPGPRAFLVGPGTTPRDLHGSRGERAAGVLPAPCHGKVNSSLDRRLGASGPGHRPESVAVREGARQRSRCRAPGSGRADNFVPRRPWLLRKGAVLHFERVALRSDAGLARECLANQADPMERAGSESGCPGQQYDFGALQDRMHTHNAVVGLQAAIRDHCERGEHGPDCQQGLKSRCRLLGCRKGQLRIRSLGHVGLRKVRQGNTVPLCTAIFNAA